MAPIFSEIKENISQKPAPKAKQKVAFKNEEAKKVIRRKPKEDEAPRIKDALQGKFKEDKITAKEQHAVYFKPSENNDFSVEQLKVKWTEFLQRLNDKPNLKATLAKFPSIEDKVNLILEIDNSVQQDLILKIKPELVSWLRGELKNSNIQLNIKITDKIQDKIIYSDNDRYEELLKKNPDLALLKQTFRLDFSG